MDKKISLTLLSFIILVVLAFGACSHQLNEDSPYLSDKEKSELFLSANQKRNQSNPKPSYVYILRDSSLTERPLWVAAPLDWAKENESVPEQFEYLTYETEPKHNRNLACDLSRANIRLELAIKIAEVFKKDVALYAEEKAAVTEKKTRITSFFNEQFPDKIQSFLKGAQVLGTYWEYREYRKELGASADYKAYTCASLIRMHKNNIQKAIEHSKDYLLSGKVLEKPDSELRALVERNAKELLKSYVIVENQLP